MIDEPGLVELVLEMQEAALQPELWPSVLARLGSLLNAVSVEIGISSPSNCLEFFISTTSDPGLHQTLHDRYSTPATNPYLKFMMSAPPRMIGLRESIQSDREMLRSDFYNDIIRRIGGYYIAVGSVHRDTNYMSPFSVHRRRSAGNFDDVELRFLNLLLPHLDRSMRLFRCLRDMEARVDLAGAILDRSEYGVIVTNAAGRVGTTNFKAEALLAEADGLLIRRGVLTAAKQTETEQLSRLIANAAGQASGRSHRSADAMQITRPSQRRPLTLAITPLRDRTPPFRHPFGVSIAVRDPERAPEAKTDMLARLYNLTAREAGVQICCCRVTVPALRQRCWLSRSLPRGRISSIFL